MKAECSSEMLVHASPHGVSVLKPDIVVFTAVITSNLVFNNSLSAEAFCGGKRRYAAPETLSQRDTNRNFFSGIGFKR
jgi:hypothetical protein